ncbi:MAG: integrase, partial [Blastopirellula sp.]|nr:integrase [Blastopirellula sp.]
MAKPRVPSYRLHKRSGQAIVTISGKMFYLGLYDSAESKAEYQRLISEWLASGQRAPQSASATTVNELLLAFIRHAKQHYRDADGNLTGTHEDFKPVMRALKQQYGTASVERFTPKSLKALREQWIESGHSRRYINDNCARIKQIFKWGVSEEMVAESTFRALSTVTSLQANRSKARETEPRQPVPIADIDATLEHLPDVVGDMVRLQLLLACRPT